MSTKVRRLFEQFQPENYQLDLATNSKELTFVGSVIIRGRKTGRPSKRITLHQKELSVRSAKLFKIEKQEKKEITVDRINTHKAYDELRIHSDTDLYTGEYEIHINFSGSITRPMHGLYPSYFDHNGTQKMLLATQFESHHAREVFPSIDEPEAKATFDLALTTPQGETVLANTPIKKQTEGKSGVLQTVFETTPIMSTYLLAFVIGEMHAATAKTNDGIEVKTWATVAQPISSLKYANDEAVKILEFFTDYFKTPFPLKKVDQVALPDFESGAMENWGLITYREIALLADQKNRSLSSEQYVSMVVAHELSHQWFGNLVTMKWWDDLWLNESFASLMEHIALDKLHPDWFQWEQYASSDVIACSARDVFKDVQSVHVEVRHPDEIGTLFDPAIVYAKGGRLLKMMLDYIGEEAFRSALKSYFQKYAYKNTAGKDLWNEMALASNKNIAAFMDPWVSKSGMPLLKVDRKDNKIALNQERFLLDNAKDGTTWPIPLLADTDLGIDILDTKSTEIPVTSDKTVIFNKNGSAHTLVQYLSQADKNNVADAFSKQLLLSESRINILNDLLLLARRGDSPLSDSLDIAKKSASEPRDAVWQILSRAISTAIGLVEGDKQLEAKIKEFRAELVKDWYEKLGWDDSPEDDPNTISLRQSVLSMMVASEDKLALAEASKRFHSVKSIEDLPAEQRSMIVSSVVKQGENVIDQLIEEYKTCHNPDVLLSISAGLTNTRNPEDGRYIIKQALGADGFVRPQDIFRWYAYLMRNQHTRKDAWKWMVENWGRLEKLFGDSKSFEYFVVYSAMPINTVEWQNKFVEFFTPLKDVVALRRNINIALSEIDSRVELRKREEPRIKEYFQ